MRPDWKTSLTTAFQALGPERVARGLAARGHNWTDCFLALALYGAPGALGRELERRWSKERAVSDMVSVPVHVVREVVRVWDQEEEAFRALAAEWLETNRTPVPTPAPVGV